MTSSLQQNRKTKRALVLSDSWTSAERFSQRSAKHFDLVNFDLGGTSFDLAGALHRMVKLHASASEVKSMSGAPGVEHPVTQVVVPTNRMCAANTRYHQTRPAADAGSEFHARCCSTARLAAST
jgi:hypothetical protein